MMRSLATSMTIVLASVALMCCGANNGNRVSSSSSATTAGGYLHNDDADADRDDGRSALGQPRQDEESLFSQYGDKADPATRQAVSSTIKRYYTAAARGDGATACSLLSPGLVEQLAHSGDQSPAAGAGGCAAAVSQMLSQQSRQLASEGAANVVVVSVHAKNGLGIAVLGFPSAPERQIAVERDGGQWKVDSVFDNGLP